VTELILTDGRFIPVAINISLNPFVTMRDRNVHGPHAEFRRPERWLPRYSEAGA
jgi:hypothetical protein